MNYVDPKVQEQLDLVQALNQVSEQEALESRDGEVTRNANGRIVEGPDGSDEQLSVTFTTEATYSRLKTHQTGMPSWIDVDFITIVAPGQARQTVIHAPVEAYHQWRFPVEYKRFKEGQAALEQGTPLEQWAVLQPSLRKVCEANGVRTIEQLSTLQDGTPIPGLQALKKQAKAYLEQAKDTAAAGRLQLELDERDRKHSLELEGLKAQMAELLKLSKAAEPKVEKPAKG